ncbi:MAG: nitroreductase [Candidatus Bathyarchaeota archaeon]|jgi:nitroreductase
MNPVVEAINSRRSTRAYEQKPIPEDILNAIIEAGNQAPFTSMTHAQPWRFVVVQDTEFKKKLLQTAFPFWKNAINDLKEKAPPLYELAMSLYNVLDEPKDVVYYEAPAIVFVIGPKTGGAVSCALACENMMIAAQSFGLGSCYVGFGALVRGNPEVVQALELKDDEAIYGPILLGYPLANPSEDLAKALATLLPNKKEPVTKWI